MKVNCAQLGSVTRLDYLLQFVHFFKPCGNKYLANIAYILRQFL